MTKFKDLPAYSTETGIEYPDWGALVQAESNGYVVVVIITNTKTGKSWPWTKGPFGSHAEADKYRNRTRAKWKREESRYPNLAYQFFVRPAWKDMT